MPRGHVATTPEEAEDVYVSELGGGGTFASSRGANGGLTGKPTVQHDIVIKAQVLAGGRGLGSFDNGFQGGVHVVTR